MNNEDLVEMVCDWAAIAQETEANQWATPRAFFVRMVDKFGFDAAATHRIQ
jgi:hypothetical protein